jgi:NTP pyrophosphatase (non-canonical NTP hydrolase)
MTHDDIIYEIEARAEAAQKRYGEMTSSHEGLGVAFEEWHELIDAVRMNDLWGIERECKDLAAVLIRLARACRNGGSFKQRSVK